MKTLQSLAVITACCVVSAAGGGLPAAAAALAALLLAGVVLLGCSEAPAVQADDRPAARTLAATQKPESTSPDHVVAAEGDVDYREPLKYTGQPAVQ